MSEAVAANFYDQLSDTDLQALIDNPPVTPCGDFILIRVETVKHTVGSIVLPDKHVDREQKGAGLGYIVAVGEYAWADDENPWAKVGDKVVFQRYEGVVPPVEGLDTGTLRLINDNKVLGVVNG